jgi:Protein of unknown function (DUF1376)
VSQVEPLTPIDCDLRDFPFMPLDVVRLRDSDLSATATGDEFRCAVLLWCASWHQVPAASLPNDDIVLSQLAGFGRVVKEWKKVREGALKGWVLCSDGRYYHPVVAQKANEAWQGRLEYRRKKEDERLRKAEARARQKSLDDQNREPDRPNLSAGQNPNVHGTDPESPPENALIGKGIVESDSGQWTVDSIKAKLKEPEAEPCGQLDFVSEAVRYALLFNAQAKKHKHSARANSANPFVIEIANQKVTESVVEEVCAQAFDPDNPKSNPMAYALTATLNRWQDLKRKAADPKPVRTINWNDNDSLNVLASRLGTRSFTGESTPQFAARLRLMLDQQNQTDALKAMGT